MDRWRSYPDFATLLDDLIEANGLSNRELARRITSATGTVLSNVTIFYYRRGERQPSYAFIRRLLDTNILHLNPSRILPASGSRPAGDQRIALFSAAGFIEVTPASIRAWNRDVLCAYRRRIETGPCRTQLRWGDLMTKLLSFQLQGGRQTLADIAAFVQLPGAHRLSSGAFLAQLLLNRSTPSQRQRLALAHYAGLDDGQAAAIEDSIASGRIPLGFAHRKSPFAAAWGRILDRLGAQSITQRQFVRLCSQPNFPGSPRVQQHDLSAWRYGRQGISLTKLRCLTTGLKQLSSLRLRDPITVGDIDQLIAASGFTSLQLSDTTHDLIERIDAQTGIKPLLSALLSAVDTSLTPDEVHRRGTKLGYAVPSAVVLWSWVIPGETYPTAEQVRDLLLLQNQFIRGNGFPPLSEEEIDKVVEVTERDYARWQELRHTEKLAERQPRIQRQPLSASFDEGAGAS